ncbi:hypothetical protein AB0C93_03020 [Streptomyces sp. NPDC048518]|uniref:hypothetical protein n=1 Tax=Streptomyces sp. NPDC048518 TaxID=3155029 RepID=UPI0033D19452
MTTRAYGADWPKAPSTSPQSGRRDTGSRTHCRTRSTNEQWTSYSRWDMLAHPNFPADAADRLTRSGESRDRAVAAAHPGLSSERIEALLVDAEGSVRRRAATNAAIDASRLVELLGAADTAVASGAAANRRLPAAAMRLVLDQAGW